MTAPHKPRRRWLLGPLSLAFIAPCAQGAAFVPGAEADPPTGDVTQVVNTPAEPLRGSGIQWTFAPWRFGGTLALELRAVRLDDGLTSRQALLMTELDMGSYIWQPWFVQVRLGVGFVTGQTSGDAQSQSNLGGSLTGRAAIVVFPASRFPFEFRADATDSRTEGVGLGGDYSSRRVSVSQGWRPLTGNAQLQLQANYSELLNGISRDKLTTFSATALRQDGPHTLDVGVMHSDNSRDDADERTRLSSISARHGFHPTGNFNVQSFASWNEARLQGSAAAFDNDLRQLSSFASWRGARDLWAGAGEPSVAASVRWVQTRSVATGSSAADSPQTISATVGVAQELSPSWRASLSGSANHLQSSTLSGDSAGAQASLNWTPRSRLMGGWRYSPSAGVSAGYSRSASQDARLTLGLQGSHGVSRDLPLSESSSLSLTLSQSAGLLKESEVPEPAQALSHGASLSWQSAGGEGGQSFGGLSYSDSQTFGSARGHFRLFNVQVSQRSQLSRFSQWSVDLTVQGTSSQSSEIDVFSGQQREQALGWQRFYSGSLSYENQRALGVPRLRHTVLLSVNSQILSRRALGDIDAPRERISESLETRLDYAIGRLDTRLSLRVARVEGRTVAALQARAQRRF